MARRGRLLLILLSVLLPRLLPPGEQVPVVLVPGLSGSGLGPRKEFRRVP